MMFNQCRVKAFVGDREQETERHQSGIDRHRHKDRFRLNKKRTNDNTKTTKTDRRHREKREFKAGFALGHTNPMVRC